MHDFEGWKIVPSSCGHSLIAITSSQRMTTRPTKVRFTRALMRFNGCMACGRQFLLPIFVKVRVSQIFSASVMGAISLATNWPFMRRPYLLSRSVAKHDTQITGQAQTHGRARHNRLVAMPQQVGASDNVKKHSRTHSIRSPFRKMQQGADLRRNDGGPKRNPKRGDCITRLGL